MLVAVLVGKTRRCATLRGDGETATHNKASIHAVLMYVLPVRAESARRYRSGYIETQNLAPRKQRGGSTSLSSRLTAKPSPRIVPFR